jgi:hypothetical protein
MPRLIGAAWADSLGKAQAKPAGAVTARVLAKRDNSAAIGFAFFVICVDKIAVALVELKPKGAPLAKAWPVAGEFSNVRFAAGDREENSVVISAHCSLLSFERSNKPRLGDAA